jgi:hypothetical protein
MEVVSSVNYYIKGMLFHVVAYLCSLLNNMNELLSVLLQLLQHAVDHSLLRIIEKSTLLAFSFNSLSTYRPSCHQVE